MSNENTIDGVCCQLCALFDKSECPVKEASPWSKWGSFCSSYKPDTNNLSAKPFPFIGESVSNERCICGSGFNPECQFVGHSLNPNIKAYVFLAGPIAGVENYKENFAEAERIVREKIKCEIVWNPSCLPDGMDLWWYMQKCLGCLSKWASNGEPEGNIIVYLPGIGPRSGANIEIAYARYLGFRVISLESLK